VELEQTFCECCYYALMATGLLDVECPCCSATLKVDVATGKVITHKEAQRPAPIEDLGAAVAALKVQAAKRDEIFEKSFADQKTRQSVLDRKFDELFKQAKEDPNQAPLKRDIDLD
jgi:hypothetical protein